MGLLSSRQKSYLNHGQPISTEMNGISLGSRLANLNSDGLYCGPINNKGTAWFVDSVNGSASNGGTGWDDALSTVAAAYTLASAGDTIYITGTHTISTTITVAKAGLSFIGVGNAYNQAQLNGAADTPVFTLNAKYTRIENLYFRVPAYSAVATVSAITTSAASNTAYTRIIGCRFQGQTASRNAIYVVASATVSADNWLIEGNEFMYLNTGTHGCAILGEESGGYSFSAWRVLNNIFNSCVTAMNFNGRVCTVAGNIIGEYGINASSAVAAVLALGIDLSGTSSGANMVYGNQLGGTYDATLYKVGASGDQWAGNFNALTGGVTAANPA